MDRHEQRSAALPHDEDDLRSAFFDGRLDEHAWCELKRELPPKSRAANLELARDLASLAVDGGSLYIGVDEKAPDGNPLRPQPLTGLRERVDQVGQSRVTPALFVESYEIPASGQPGLGYLEVVVRASADAPHQVEGTYYGRSDTGKCRLPDQQVERLMREREQQRHGAEDALRAFVTADPCQGQDRAHPHLFVFAHPGVRRPEMCRDVIAAAADFRPLISLVRSVSNDVVVPMYSTTPEPPSGLLVTLLGHRRQITGGVTLSSRSAWGSADEQHYRELTIDEDGDLKLYHAGVGWDIGPVNGVSRKVLSGPEIVGSVREFMAVAVAVSHRIRVPGSWHIGIALTGIRGYCHQVAPDWPGYGPPCIDDEYVRMEHFNLAVMERTPWDVADKLLGRLLRGLRADTNPAVQAMLTDPAVASAAENPDRELERSGYRGHFLASRGTPTAPGVQLTLAQVPCTVFAPAVTAPSRSGPTGALLPPKTAASRPTRRPRAHQVTRWVRTHLENQQPDAGIAQQPVAPRGTGLVTGYRLDLPAKPDRPGP